MQKSPPLANETSLNRQRHEESFELYARALECLSQSEEDHFQNRELLQEAADCLLESIRHNRRHAEPYIAMGYLLWICQDPVWAMHYLEEALRLEPTHEDIHTLIARIKGKPLKPEEIEQIAFADSPAPEALATHFAQALEEMSAEKISAIAPTINPHLLSRLEEKQVYWFNRYEELQVEANRSRDVQTKQRLREQIQPMRELTQKYRDALRVSHEMIALSDQMLENSQQTQRYLEVASRPMTSAQWQEMQGYVDILLDNCDQFADSLEQFENQQIVTGSLYTQYQQLSERIETLQELLARQIGPA
jgi:hypothetical protein